MSETTDSMDPVKRQYEVYPYPDRDPADEAKRLIEGSPSHPVEIDHYLFAGRRDWSAPFRALVAGGGTGDGLTMLAQRLADIGCPAEITYLDISESSRAIAEARAEARGLKSIRFLTGDLVEAPGLGPFDYIDCCGVLHHLSDPDAGFRALAGALAPGGGLGLMVYAPYGRTGVYPMQAAFARLLAEDPPEERVRLARTVLAALPETNWFRRNELVGDHRSSDAGLYDLLLHARDRPYAVRDLAAALDQAGLALVSFLEPDRYDPRRFLPQSSEVAERVAALAPLERAALAEQLSGNLAKHVFYAARPGETVQAKPTSPEDVPHLRGVAAPALSRHVAQKGPIPVKQDGLTYVMDMPRSAAPLIAQVDGARSLGQITSAVRMDWLAFSAAWAPVHRGLTGFNFLHYSRGARR